jgi:hypothetical protein
MKIKKLRIKFLKIGKNYKKRKINYRVTQKNKRMMNLKKFFENYKFNELN